MRSVQAAASEPLRMQKDFVDREYQMFEDLRALQLAINGLWAKPLADFDKLLLRERNSQLLGKYNLEISAR